MEVYIVRHGETDGNVARRHQAKHSLLTALGKTQAEEVATKLAKVRPTHVISSRLVRAIDTARIIGDACDLMPETSEYFIELEQPPYLYGRHLTEPSSIWFYLRWYFGLVGSRPGHGESYQALRQRFQTAKEQLAKLPPDSRVVVVSHAAFISFFLSHLCSNKALSVFGALKVFLLLVRMKNTAYYQVRYEPEGGKRCGWTIVEQPT